MAWYNEVIKRPTTGISHGAALVSAHAELQTFNEEQDLHRNNARVLDGFKLPAFRFDESHLKHP